MQPIWSSFFGPVESTETRRTEENHLQTTLCPVLTEADEEGGHGLVLGHVDQPSAQTEVREDQQHLLDDVIDVGDVLGEDTGL